jgi:hypothetical protein
VNFSLLIREIRRLVAEFLRPQSPKQQFLIGFLVLSIVAGIGSKLSRDSRLGQRIDHWLPIEVAYSGMDRVVERRDIGEGLMCEGGAP